MTTDKLTWFYCFAGGGLLLSVLLGLTVSACMPGINKRSKSFFIASFSVLALSIVAYVTDLFIYTDPNLAPLGTVVAFFETFPLSLLMPLITSYVLYCCGESRRKNPLFIAELVLWTALFVLLIITQFTDGIYYFTPDNQFVRGVWYPVLIVPMIGLIVVNLFGVIRRRNKLTKKHFIAFLVYLFPLMIAMIIHTFVSVFWLIVIAVSVSALSMSGIIIADQIEQNIRQQREIADQRARIAVLQMRPHFIYNTMMSIYYLCKQDSEKAQQVTLDFTTYLRKNFNAVAGREPIPFSEELEHTRAYLAVEQAQFEDNLRVEYDTPHTLFRVPPLTLQPIVENAVKHGMDPDASEPLLVSIKTAQTDSGSEIVVEDNGPGFKATDDSTPHTALNNIRERLSNIGASLTVSSREQGGTTVRIFIPKD